MQVLREVVIGGVYKLQHTRSYRLSIEDRREKKSIANLNALSIHDTLLGNKRNRDLCR
jgi:hypothetical protein